MKRYLVIALVVLSILVMSVGIVSAAPLASSKTASLVSVIYVPGAGPVFTFEVHGHFSRSDLNGSVHVPGGDDFGLYCRQVDASSVRCTASKQVAGKNVVLKWGGFTFWTAVPAARFNVPLCSKTSDTFITINIQNQSTAAVDVYWLDYDCKPVFYYTLAPGQSYAQGTYITHPWQFVNAATKAIMLEEVATTNGQVITIK